MAFFPSQASARFAGQCYRGFSRPVRHYGSSPEMAILGSRRWQSMLNNLNAQQHNAPLFRADILNSQRLSTIEGEMSEVVESNRRMLESHEKLQHNNHALTTIKQ